MRNIAEKIPQQLNLVSIKMSLCNGKKDCQKVADGASAKSSRINEGGSVKRTIDSVEVEEEESGDG